MNTRSLSLHGGRGFKISSSLCPVSTGCCNATENVQYMRELNMPAHMRTLISKLLYRLREKRKASACEIIERYNRRPQFTDTVTFIERQVKIISDPVFGDIQTTPANTESKSVNKLKSNPQSKHRFKGDSFATVTTIETPIVEDLGRSNQSKASAHTCNSCICCFKGHTLDQCPQFENKAHRDKITFIRTKGICFDCLHFGHLSKDCEKCLHSTDTNQQRKPSVSNALVSLKTCGQPGAGNSDGI